MISYLLPVGAAPLLARLQYMFYITCSSLQTFECHPVVTWHPRLRANSFAFATCTRVDVLFGKRKYYDTNVKAHWLILAKGALIIQTMVLQGFCTSDAHASECWRGIVAALFIEMCS